jgi:hypothetical protein
MELPMGERLLLKKALILRRIFSAGTVPMDVLLRSLEDDDALIREKAPGLYYADAERDMRSEIDDCVEEGLLEWITPVGSGTTLKRTRLGDQFMKTLGGRLQYGFDAMPMSGDALLDFLAHI